MFLPAAMSYKYIYQKFSINNNEEYKPEFTSRYN
jgi:hypothetical protein